VLNCRGAALPKQLKSLGAAPCASSTATCRMIVSDNGTELTSNAVLAWCGESDAFSVCEGEIAEPAFGSFGAVAETPERQPLSVMDEYPIYLALPEARATSSSTFESKSFKIGDRFDFL